MRVLRIAAFTQGHRQPSARFRVRQCIGELRHHDVLVSEFVAKFGAYPPVSKLLRVPWGIGSLASRVPALVRSHSFDAVWLQRELISSLPTLEFLTQRPRVFDVDDAVWLHSRFHASERIARLSDAVVCGNGFLAEHFRREHKRVHIVPTSVDSSRFNFRRLVDGDRLVIGWSGSSSGFPFLRAIQSSLARVLARFPQAVLRIVADRPPVPAILPSRSEFVQWSEEGEVAALHTFDVGLMPLSDDDWSRGKCSFKMLTYMATGTPVVASPVGMNVDILARHVGLSASSPDEWVDALTALLSAYELRVELGRTGRKVVEREFATDVVSKQLAEIFRLVAG